MSRVVVSVGRALGNGLKTGHTLSGQNRPTEQSAVYGSEKIIIMRCKNEAVLSVS